MSERECQQALKDFYSAVEKAHIARDTEGMLATMSEDIVLLAPDIPLPLSVRRPFAATIRTLLPLLRSRDITPQNGLQSKAMWYSNGGDIRGSMKPIAVGNAIPLNSRFLFVFRREPSGKLLMWRAMMNYEAPPAPPK